jgi:hypothetical protein
MRLADLDWFMNELQFPLFVTARRWSLAVEQFGEGKGETGRHQENQHHHRDDIGSRRSLSPSRQVAAARVKELSKRYQGTIHDRRP